MNHVVLNCLNWFYIVFYKSDVFLKQSVNNSSAKIINQQFIDCSPVTAIKHIVGGPAYFIVVKLGTDGTVLYDAIIRHST